MESTQIRESIRNQPYTKERNAHRSSAQAIRKVVLREQRFACGVCEWKLDEFGTGLEVHHIVPVKDGGGEGRDNLISLCPNHHAEADRGLFSISLLQEHRERACGKTPLAMDWYWEKLKPAIERLETQRAELRTKFKARHRKP